MHKKFWPETLKRLTMCKFNELPEVTVARDGNCFLRSLGTQQEDEDQNNVASEEVVQQLSNDWERFRYFFAFYLMKVDVRLHIYTRVMLK
jgi:translation initiation factor 2 beta subunit (eIF-2beta)/eIF-5